MSHVARVNESCQTSERFASHVRMSHATRMHGQSHTCEWDIQICKHTYIICTYTHIYAQTSLYAHVYIHTNFEVSVYTYIYIYTQILKSIHIYLYVYIHIYTCIYMNLLTCSYTYSPSHLRWHFRKLFQSSKFKARTSLFTETWRMRHSSCEFLSFETAFKNVSAGGIGCIYMYMCRGIALQETSDVYDHVCKHMWVD